MQTYNDAKKRKVGRPKKTDSIPGQPDDLSVNIDVELSSDSNMSSSSTVSKINSLNCYDLMKRNSATTASYDLLLGPSLALFPSSKFPHQRAVLQRYHHLITSNNNPTRSEEITMITNEIIPLWELSSIPLCNRRRCRDVVEKCIKHWIDAKIEVRKSQNFQASPDTLLDLRPSNLIKLSVLKIQLMTSGDKGKQDYEFFKGQLSFPQTSSIAGKDQQVYKKGKEMEQKSLNAAKYAEKNKGEFSGSSPPSSRVKPDMIINEANTIIKSPRQCVLAETSVVVSSNESSQSETESEWSSTLRFSRELSKKPEHLTLKLPAKTIPRLLAGTSTSTKTSIRNELKLVATLVEVGGGDVGDASLSIQTIHHQRKEATTDRANKIRKEIKIYKGMKDKGGYFVVLHWDGKIIQIMTGETEDRLAIALSSPNLI